MTIEQILMYCIVSCLLALNVLVWFGVIVAIKIVVKRFKG
jgi:hypothetical protein